MSSFPRACCRLRIANFKIPSLHQYADQLHGVDERDFALATSPNISSIVVPVSHYDIDGCVEYNEEAVLQMAAGLAPNLIEVHIVHGMLGASPYFFDAVDRGRPPWRGFFVNKRQGVVGEVSQTVHLKCWSLSPARIEYFATWEEAMDFSELRTLQLWEVTSDVLALAKRPIQLPESTSLGTRVCG